MGRKRKGENYAKRPKRTKRAKSIKKAWENKKLKLENQRVLFSELSTNLMDGENSTSSSSGDVTSDLANNHQENQPSSSFNAFEESNTNQTSGKNVNIEGKLKNLSDTDTVSTSDISVFENAERIMALKQSWAMKKYPPKVFPKENIPGTIRSSECESIENHPFCIETCKVDEKVAGCRIVEIQYYTESLLDLQYNHLKNCTMGRLEVSSEYKTNMGLASCIILQCTSCEKTFKIFTEHPKYQKKSAIHECKINTAVVWGTLASGGSFSHTNEFLTTMNIPPLPSTKFYKIEEQLGNFWKNSLWLSMEDAGRREREEAIRKGNLCSDNVPWITVYLDGSWSKRSYGHSFNALSGMVGIIGKYTGEIIFIAVRNRFCSICARAESKGIEIKEHTCYKNWNKSAPAMEADMVTEGFSQSEQMHGVRYCKFIADGDSSTYANIKSKVSYGQSVEKIEGTNHALKNYGKHLYRIMSDKKINCKGRKLLNKDKIQHLTKRAKTSIYEHAKKGSFVTNLKSDLQNGLHHVFNDHSLCQSEICNTPGDTSKSQIMELKSTGVYFHLCGVLDLLIKKSHMLIQNENNNSAERLMNIAARFTMGKRLNFIQRGSYERRIYLAGLRYNHNFYWPIKPWIAVCREEPGQYFQEFIDNSAKQYETIQKNKQKYKENLTTRRSTTSIKQKQTKNVDYGPSAEQPEEDESYIEEECGRILEQLRVSEDERKMIPNETKGQFLNEAYLKYKERRLTASNFGRVFKRRPQTPCHSIVKQCLGKYFFTSAATEYGISKEDVAIKFFENETNLNVEKTGLHIDKNYNYLGASPDGLIGENAIVEVKCLFSASKTEETCLKTIVKNLKTCCLKVQDDAIYLNKKHSYYYQIQGSLNICEREKCYFIVYINDAIPLHIEEISRDQKLWEEMLPVLTKFYTNCILTEIIRDNIGKGKKCVDPKYILEEIEKRKNLTNKRKYENDSVMM